MKYAIAFAALIFSLQVHATKIPVIYVHGVGAPYQLFEAFDYMKKLFNKHGYPLYIAQTPATASIEDSADKLYQEIRKFVPTGPYHLIGHSMGGLVARSAINKYALHDRCKSLWLVSVPNKGSLVANWAWDKFQSNQETPGLKNILKWFADDINVIQQLTTTHVEQKFNALVDNRGKLPIFSIGYYIPKPIYLHTQNPYLLLGHLVNTFMGHPISDGLVSLESAKWSTYLGSFPGDHYATQGPVPFKGRFIYIQSFEKIIKKLEVFNYK